ncbi:hypothetical protein EVAR_23917_1 [Eumeta japonica]|uniref:Integrase catalytic domain-containing protein n=1 Tax=Eumeta variegata TaxID=151549 RepID=A0A4C1V146_EUMVA|nr:hypothetical protein EVAR_23917_1 [Eumeta japonica]
MISHRGYPTEIYSDNGSNLHGAERKLKKARKEETSKPSIVRKYIPPGAPFMAGVWDRLVTFLKTALYNVLHKQHSHEETLHRLLCEAEYTVNGRSSTHMFAQIEDNEALTPNNFLLGGYGLVQTPGSFIDAE